MPQLNLQSKGFLLVNKPVGLTSFQVVKKVRYLSKVKRVGHAGTLDPFASGLLILALDRVFTRQIDNIQAKNKVYSFSIVFGLETDTLDSYGKVVKRSDSQIDKDSLQKVLATFFGKQEQVPPIFSAKKKDGKRLYELARNNITDVEIKPSNIEIFDIKLEKFFPGKYSTAIITINCSKGTYVRSLARDIAYNLGTVAYTRDLVRTYIGQFSLNDAVNFNELSTDLIRKSLITNY